MRRPAKARWSFAARRARTCCCSISCCPIATAWRSARSSAPIRIWQHIPVIFLTARAAEADRIIGLEIGANDYVVKPFFVRELIARIRLQFRTQSSPARILEAGGLELDRNSRRVRLRGDELSLTATEFRLLEYLMARPGVVFSREQLLDAVWSDRAITDRAVDVYILRLRQKIEREPTAPLLIHSVRGFGYTFEPRMQTAAEQDHSLTFTAQ